MTAQKMTVQDWQFEGDQYISIDGGMSINLNSKDGLWLVKNLLGLQAQSAAERGAAQSAKVDAAHEDRRDNAALPAVVRLPEKVKLPCDCYNGELMSGCECGNYDDAHSQGYAQGWNDAIDSAMRGSK